MTKIFHYGLPLAFGLLLLLSWTDALFWGAGTQVQSFENKAAVKTPVFRPDLLDPFPRDAEAYFNDQFPWKGLFQRFNAKLQALTNRRSPLPDLVVVGQDEWLYKGGLQLDIYRGKRRFTPAELNQVVDELLARRDSIRARGGKYYLAIAPLKHHIYPEFLPDHVRPLNQQYAARQLYAALDQTELPYIDLHTPLRNFALNHLPLHLRPRPEKYSAKNDLYFRTDHHWTVKAGLLAAQTITDRMIADGFPLQPLDTSTYTISVKPAKGMTLAQIIGADRPDQDFSQTLHHDWTTKEVPRADITIPDRFPYKQNYVRQRLKTNARDRTELPSLFVNRESFGENLIHPLSEHFSSTFFLFDEWKHHLNLPDYDREGGDIYLQLIWEGFLFNLLEIPQDDGKW
ncbi:alginate O-acetyltransferase AlgX-related protein [Neolewinella persica]|uniref:alginate O-acetyltransferase AlgX-related protein n=1 Tax=Neolewinella persica TaxID=70998 RepID=UPI000373EEAF|nr:hypothetical protein [Neolewinella persica]